MKIDINSVCIYPESSIDVTTIVHAHGPTIMGFISMLNDHTFHESVSNSNSRLSVKSIYCLVPSESNNSHVAECGTLSSAIVPDIIVLEPSDISKI